MRMRRANLPRFALFKTTNNFHSIFNEMKISFLHDIPLYPTNWNHTGIDLKLSTFNLKLKKSSVTYCCVSFFVQYIWKLICYE